MAKVNRQKGSEKVWLNEKDGTLWNSVTLHSGRTSRQFNGPQAMTVEEAKDGLNEAVRGHRNSSVG